MFKVLEYFLVAVFIGAITIASKWLGSLAYSWMPPIATAEAQHVDDLFSFLVAVGAFILLGLLGMMLYSVIFFRAKPDDYSEGHPSRGNATLEIIWTVTPTLLVLWIAIQNINIYQQLNILGLKQIVQLPLESPAYAASDLPKPAAEQVQVIAKQWDWTFQYPNNVTSHELHLPVNQSTRLDLQARDVIHGFYIPAFRLKQDMIPGRDIDLVVTPTRIGKYRLQDSQFSGTYFALMEANVYVESPEAYNQWLADISTGDRATTDPVIAEQMQPPQTLFKTRWSTGSAAESVANSPKPKDSNS
jgi:cytochrome c oxidase subunit 2